VLRGVHYQNPPRAQAKLVTATKGKVFDVAVDIRQGSPTYGQWIGVELNETEKAMLFIPEGFAHGFCALTDNAEIIYFCTVEYAPEHEGGIVWNDPTIAIDWPVKNPILADRDAAFPSLEEASNVFEYKAA
ncbi:MAG: dTDP-4-dehydrorhamnose 3,5-epimerase, partial [Acidobacteriota bacterium]